MLFDSGNWFVVKRDENIFLSRLIIQWSRFCEGSSFNVGFIPSRALMKQRSVNKSLIYIFGRINILEILPPDKIKKTSRPIHRVEKGNDILGALLIRSCYRISGHFLWRICDSCEKFMTAYGGVRTIWFHSDVMDLWRRRFLTDPRALVNVNRGW